MADVWHLFEAATVRAQLPGFSRYGRLTVRIKRAVPGITCSCAALEYLAGSMNTPLHPAHA